MEKKVSVRKCPICGGEFEEGLIADKTTDLSIHDKAKWATRIRGFNILGGGLENAHEIKTYRCKNCGYLESYAE